MQGGAATPTAATFTLNTAKNTAAGTNALLSGSFSAGAPAKGVMVVNTTGGKSSRAWIYKSIGGSNWDVTQPATPLVVPVVGAGFYVPSEVTTWASTDTVNLLTPIAINIVDIGATLVDFSANANNAILLYNLTVFAPTGASIASGSLMVGNEVVLIESASQRTLVWNGTNGIITLEGGRNADALASINVPSNPNGTSTAGVNIGWFAGCVDTSLAHGYISGFSGDLDTIIGNGTLIAGDYNSFGTWANDGVVTVTYGTLATTSSGSQVWYGTASGSLNMAGSSHLANLGGTFTNVFTAPTLVSPGIQLNGVSTACSHTKASPDVQNCNVSTTPAHLDSATAGDAGFNSVAFTLGGASVANF